jgi:hypothetical protein
VNDVWAAAAALAAILNVIVVLVALLYARSQVREAVRA